MKMFPLTKETFAELVKKIRPDLEEATLECYSELKIDSVSIALKANSNTNKFLQIFPASSSINGKGLSLADKKYAVRVPFLKEAITQILNEAGLPSEQFSFKFVRMFAYREDPKVFQIEFITPKAATGEADVKHIKAWFETKAESISLEIAWQLKAAQDIRYTLNLKDASLQGKLIFSIFDSEGANTKEILEIVTRNLACSFLSEINIKCQKKTLSGIDKLVVNVDLSSLANESRFKLK